MQKLDELKQRKQEIARLVQLERLSKDERKQNLEWNRKKDEEEEKETERNMEDKQLLAAGYIPYNGVTFYFQVATFGGELAIYASQVKGSGELKKFPFKKVGENSYRLDREKTLSKVDIAFEVEKDTLRAEILHRGHNNFCLSYNAKSGTLDFFVNGKQKRMHSYGLDLNVTSSGGFPLGLDMSQTHHSSIHFAVQMGIDSVFESINRFVAGEEKDKSINLALA